LKLHETKLLQPGEDVEFADELAAADAYSLNVRLNENHNKTVDPASYIDCKWEGNKLKITNVTGSPVYVSVEDINA
jgi:hypothetical protein